MSKELIGVIHKNTRDGSFAIVPPECLSPKASKTTYISPTAQIWPGTKIGRECKVGPHVVVGASSFESTRPHSEQPATKIGNHSVLAARAKVALGARLSEYVKVGEDCTIGRATLNEGASVSGTSIVEDDVLISAGAMILRGCTIGKGSTIGSRSYIGMGGGVIISPDTINGPLCDVYAPKASVRAASSEQ